MRHSSIWPPPSGRPTAALSTAAQGKIEHAAAQRTLSYGALTRGQKLLKTIGDDVPLTPADHWQVAGHSISKINGRTHVTGQHHYSSDQKRPGTLRGKVLRGPAIGAALASVDTSAAEALPGVTVVHEGDFVGVAAADELTAEKALAAIKAEWKSPPKTCNDRTIFEYLKAHADGGDRDPALKEALKTADVTIEQSYTALYIAHIPLEPRAAVAEWEGEKLMVWAGSQRPFGVRSELMQAFGLPADAVHVIVPDTGSGYGGKQTGEAAIEAARLARATRRPVKVIWTREEEFTWAYFRPAGLVEAAAGARKDGTLTAWEFHVYNAGGSGVATPYDVPHRVVASHNASSPLKQGSYRALAATFNHFARESLMDEMARALKMDPLEFRLKNLREERLRAVFQAAAERFGWGKSKAGTDRGVGIAGGTEKNSFAATCAEVAIDRAQGQVKVLRLVTAFDCGAIVNPDHLSNQVEGMQMMALGGALFERIRFQDGKLRNPRLSSYRVPRFRDMPKQEVVLLDRKDIPSAGGGETPMVGVAPAIAAAICDATGMRLRGLPLVPDGLKVS